MPHICTGHEHRHTNHINWSMYSKHFYSISTFKTICVAEQIKANNGKHSQISSVPCRIGWGANSFYFCSVLQKPERAFQLNSKNHLCAPRKHISVYHFIILASAHRSHTIHPHIFHQTRMLCVHCWCIQWALCTIYTSRCVTLHTLAVHTKARKQRNSNFVLHLF